MNHRGTIIRYNQQKRWGFVTEDGGGDYFVHQNNAVPNFELKLGLRVEFEIGEPFSIGKKVQAINVRPVGSAQ